MKKIILLSAASAMLLLTACSSSDSDLNCSGNLDCGNAAYSEERTVPYSKPQIENPARVSREDGSSYVAPAPTESEPAPVEEPAPAPVEEPVQGTADKVFDSRLQK